MSPTVLQWSLSISLLNLQHPEQCLPFSMCSIKYSLKKRYREDEGRQTGEVFKIILFNHRFGPSGMHITSYLLSTQPVCLQCLCFLVWSWKPLVHWSPLSSCCQHHPQGLLGFEGLGWVTGIQWAALDSLTVGVGTLRFGGELWNQRWVIVDGGGIIGPLSWSDLSYMN